MPAWPIIRPKNSCYKVKAALEKPQWEFSSKLIKFENIMRAWGTLWVPINEQQVVSSFQSYLKNIEPRKIHQFKNLIFREQCYRQNRKSLALHSFVKLVLTKQHD